MEQERPLSPHLTIYRPQLTSLLSITHRGTGVFLVLGIPLLVGWLAAIVAGPETYALVQRGFASFPGRTLLLAWTFSLFYHLANGIRHLCWDMGWGLELKVVYRSGWMVVATATVATLLSWSVGYGLRGGM
jgi:succinate dehydrogenase / fumarate reductase cytochrome b subunit